MAEFWSNSDRGFRLRLWVDQVSQDKAANTSQVRFRLFFMNTAATFAGYACSAYIEYDRKKRIEWSGTPSVLSPNQTILLIDQTVTIQHDGDGSKAFGVSAFFNGSGGYSPNTIGTSGDVKLTDIPRGSSTSDITAVIGKPVTININRKQNTYRHSIWVRFNNYDKKVAGDDIETSYTWTPETALYDQLPDNTSGFGEVTIIAYENGREMSRDIKRLSLTIADDIKPKLSGITLTDTNAVAGNLITSSEHFVQIMSDIKVTFDGATGIYGSTIKNYRAEIVGGNQAVNSNNGTFGIMNFNGQVTIRATVTDSRGLQVRLLRKQLLS